jgi:hypothetical protein
MKSLSLAALLVFGVTAFAQTGVNLNELEEGTTNIEIKKTRGEQVKKGEALWELADGTAEIEGEAGATNKDAKDAWKKACEGWKKEFRADNKENKIIAMNCGQSTCGGDAGSKVCTSKATYKIKTKLN